MSEYAAEQEQRENLSGNDMFECQQWEEMMIDLEKYIPFKQDFEKFVASHERNENV
jgi:hypothetical protein